MAMEDKRYFKIIRECVLVLFWIIVCWYILSGIINNLGIAIGFTGIVIIIILSYQLIIRNEWLLKLGVKILNLIGKIGPPKDFDIGDLFYRKYFPSNLISLIRLLLIVIIFMGYLPICALITKYTISYSIPLGIVSLFVMMVIGMTTLMGGKK